MFIKKFRATSESFAWIAQSILELNLRRCFFWGGEGGGQEKGVVQCPVTL